MVHEADVHPFYKKVPCDPDRYMKNPLEWDQSIQKELVTRHELTMNADNANQKPSALKSDDASHSSWTNIKDDEDNVSVLLMFVDSPGKITGTKLLALCNSFIEHSLIGVSQPPRAADQCVKSELLRRVSEGFTEFPSDEYVI